MSILSTKALLRECIHQILKEDDGFGGLGDAMAGMPYGMHYASKDQMYQIFVKPFTDVVDVAAGKTKELSQKGQTLLKTAFESVATTLVPILKDSYGEIFAKEKEEIDKIRSEYSGVYGATWDAFKEADVLIAAFMYRPDLFMTAQFVHKAPKAAAKLLSILSGGSLDKTLTSILSAAPSKGRRSSEGPGMPIESIIREKGGEKNTNVDKLVMLVKNKKVRAILSNSEKVQQMTGAGKTLVRNTLKLIFDQASAVLTANSLQDMQKKLGKKLPGVGELSRIPQQERPGAEEAMLKGIKAGMKEFYVKQLEGQVKTAVEAGVPKNHPYVSDYMRVISKIKNL